MRSRWETFEGTQYTQSSSTAPRVTLGLKGTFFLNRFAYEALGSPTAVEMLFDGNERVIGLKPTDPRRRNAFVIKPHGKRGYRRLSAAAFMKHYRIKNDRTILFENIDLDDDGVLLLDMNKTIYVGRGSR
jgi:hypothetical protein